MSFYFTLISKQMLQKNINDYNDDDNDDNNGVEDNNDDVFIYSGLISFVA